MRLVHPEQTKRIIRKYNLRPKKGLGQNFLVSEEVLLKIIRYANIEPQSLVIEIGPGIGTLTELLAESADRVLGIEIDEQMIQVLSDTLKHHKNVIMIHQDFLETNLQELYERYKLSDSKGFLIIANLPYYITTPILQKIVDNRKNLINAVVMVQKEVAERIAAQPGGKEYGSLTVAVQYYLDTEIVGTVPKSAFIPAPKVESAILRLMPKKEPPAYVSDEALFFQVVYDAFRQRRKTLFNNLKNSSFFAGWEQERIRTVFEAAGIDKMRRGETLSIQEFASLTNRIMEG